MRHKCEMMVQSKSLSRSKKSQFARNSNPSRFMKLDGREDWSTLLLFDKSQLSIVVSQNSSFHLPTTNGTMNKKSWENRSRQLKHCR